MKDFLNDLNCDRQTIFIVALSVSLIISLVGMHYDSIYKDIAVALIGVAGGYIGGKHGGSE
jgi:hypothetical protein